MGFTLFVAVVIIWYMQTKIRGDVYLKELANRTGCKFDSEKFGYGRVFGSYRGYEIEVSVNKDYCAQRGLSGFILTTVILNSVIGSVAGIRNFTSVKVRHKACLDKPFRLNDRTYVDGQFITNLPSSDKCTGLPICSVASLIERIDEMIEKAREIEHADQRD